MKTKLRFVKSLLVMAALCLGSSSAWGAEGDVIYTNDFSTNNQTDFATWLGTGKKPSGFSYAQLGRNGSFSIESGALVHTPTAGKSKSNVNNGELGTFNDAITTATSSTNYVLSFDITLAYLSHAASSTIFEVSGEDNKTVICLYATHTRTNSTTGATSYGYIVGGDNAFTMAEAQGTSTNTEGYFGNGTKHEIANVSQTTGSKTYHVILNAQTVGMAKLTIQEGETKVVDEVDVNISANKGLKYMYLSDHNSWETPASSITLDNFSIVEGAPTIAATADYTVKYVSTIGGVETEIKTAEVRTGLVDATISLTDVDKNTIWYDDVKYVYSSDNASTSIIADDNSTIVKVVFTAAPSYTYSVTDNIGNNLASGSAFAGEDVTFYVPYYAYKSSKFYKDPSLSSGTLSYGQGKITGISANTEITVTYTEDESTNVVFFSEAENLPGINVQNDGYTQGRMSNGKAGYYDTETSFITLPAGVYTIRAATRTGTTSFYAGAVGEGIKVYELTSSGAVVTTNSHEFVLSESTDIYTSTGSSTAYFDYVIIYRHGDPAVSKTITAAGWATYCSPYALDLTGAIANLDDAFIVTGGAAGVLTKTSVMGATVPANTGLLLKGNGECTIPVVSSGTADVTANKLVGVTSDTEIAANAGYVLMADPSLGFYQNSKAFTVGANTAYLPAGFDGAGARTFFQLDAETTGINAIENAETVNGIYNLAGQRVAQPTRGLYIVNGKKIVVK